MLLSRTLRLALAGLAAATLAGAQTILSGHVVDENEAPVAHARVRATPQEGAPLEAVSGPAGGFRLALPAPGRYLIDVDRTGYFQLREKAVDAGAGGTDVTLVINTQREVFQSVTVGDLAAPVDVAETRPQQRLTGTEINDIPYPSSHSLRSAMKLIPGVIQDPSGSVHFHGGAEYQTRYVLDGFDISDPVSGRYNTRLAVEGVQSMDLSSAGESPQYGRGSAGTLQIHTDTGTDQLRYTATNFIPGVDMNNGLRFGNWTPRAGVSGPIAKGRAWYSDSLDGQYNSGYLTGLPNGQDTNAAWAVGNLLHTQVNLSPADILYTDLLSDFSHQAHYGLGVLDPVSTTTALGGNEWLAAARISHAWYGGAMLEAGGAWQRSFQDRSPMGNSPYLVTPDGRSGNYFIDSREDGRREQVFVNYFPRVLSFLGRHQLQAGTDVQRLTYSALFRRTGFKVIGLSGLPIYDTTFQGSGDFGLSNRIEAAYINDHWQPLEQLTIDAGLRQDWEGLVGQSSLAPRISAAWAPFAGDRTKITAGYAILHDTTYLAMFSRRLDQQAVTVPYTNGVPGEPLVTTFAAGRNLKLPRYENWSAGVEREFPRRVLGSVDWLRRRGQDGFVYAPVGGAPGAPANLQPLLLGYGFGGTYALTNQRRDEYDEVAFTARQNFGDQYGWMASYTRSRAASNAVLDVSVDQPLQVLNNMGRMPWDAPNRVLAWAYFPIHGNWAGSVMADWRTGFPFAIVNEAGAVVGAVDAQRYPSLFDLNLAIERRFVFQGYRFAIRVGGMNMTAHRNPTAVNNTIGAPGFLQFYGDEGRHFVLRLRFFGRAMR